MKRLIALFLLACCLPLTARADDASKRAKIDELFGMLHMDTLMQQLMDSMEQQMAATTSQMIGDDIPVEKKTQLADFQKKMFVLIESQLSWKSLEPDYADMYAKAYTEPQIDDLLAFYKSPTGTVMLQKMPELATSGMKIAQARMMTLQPQLKQMVDDFAKQQAAASADKPASSEKSSKP